MSLRIKMADCQIFRNSRMHEQNHNLLNPRNMTSTTNRKWGFYMHSYIEWRTVFFLPDGLNGKLPWIWRAKIQHVFPLWYFFQLRRKWRYWRHTWMRAHQKSAKFPNLREFWRKTPEMIKGELPWFWSFTKMKRKKRNWTKPPQCLLEPN